MACNGQDNCGDMSDETLCSKCMAQYFSLWFNTRWQTLWQTLLMFIRTTGVIIMTSVGALGLLQIFIKKNWQSWNVQNITHMICNLCEMLIAMMKVVFLVLVLFVQCSMLQSNVFLMFQVCTSICTWLIVYFNLLGLSVKSWVCVYRDNCLVLS